MKNKTNAFKTMFLGNYIFLMKITVLNIIFINKK